VAEVAEVAARAGGRSSDATPAACAVSAVGPFDRADVNVDAGAPSGFSPVERRSGPALVARGVDAPFSTGPMSEAPAEEPAGPAPRLRLRPPRDPRRRRRAAGAVADSGSDEPGSSGRSGPAARTPSGAEVSSAPPEPLPRASAPAGRVWAGSEVSGRADAGSDIENFPSHDARPKTRGASVAPGGWASRRGSLRAPSRKIH
jgi:hypothetical protein